MKSRIDKIHQIKILCLSAMFLAGTISANEMRIWTSTDGQTVEAKYIQHTGNKIILEKADGKRITVPSSKLCKADREYASKQIIPEVDVEFSKKTSTISYDYDDNKVQLESSVKIKRTSREPYTGKLTVEVFIIGEDLSSGRLVVSSTKKWTGVSLPEKRGQELALIMDSITYDFDDNGVKYGIKYWGYAVFVFDALDRNIAVEASSNKLKGGLEKLRSGKLHGFS